MYTILQWLLLYNDYNYGSIAIDHGHIMVTSQRFDDLFFSEPKKLGTWSGDGDASFRHLLQFLDRDRT